MTSYCKNNRIFNFLVENITNIFLCCRIMPNLFSNSTK